MKSIFSDCKLFREVKEAFEDIFLIPSKTREHMKNITIDNFKSLVCKKEYLDKFLSIERSVWYSYFRYYLVGEAFSHLDYDNFCVFLDDMSSVSSGKTINEDFFFSRGLNLIEAILRSDYKNMPAIRKCFKLLLEKSSNSHVGEMDVFEEVLDEMIILLKDKSCYKDNSISDEDYNKMLNDRVAYILDSREKKMFYSVLLLNHDRYYYFNDKLYEIEENENIRNDIFSKINNFSIGLFNKLNDNCDEDSFKTCMDIVFDSDSYSELYSKLGSVVEASVMYESGNFSEAFYIISELSSDEYKEVYCDEMVSYPTNTMNLISKPKRIIDRMKYLYNRIDSSISYDFMDDIYYECDTVSNLISSINAHIKKEKSPFKKLIKSFIKRK